MPLKAYLTNKNQVSARQTVLSSRFPLGPATTGKKLPAGEETTGYTISVPVRRLPARKIPPLDFGPSIRIRTTATRRHLSSNYKYEANKLLSAKQNKRKKISSKSMPFPKAPSFSRGRRRRNNPVLSRSLSSDSGSDTELEGSEHVLVYHESARLIVFRDQLRRSVRKEQDLLAALEEEDVEQDFSTRSESETIRHLLDDSSSPAPKLKPRVVPLPALEFGPEDEFPPLLHANSGDTLTAEETHVVDLFQQQHCVVKTILNNEWTSFLQRFTVPETPRRGVSKVHQDIPASGDYKYNSFVTSCSMLPCGGRKMRCYGSTTQYTVGIVFALPNANDETVKTTETWAWPAGYSAKTEFNIDARGQLINGREQALVSFATLRQYNDDYLTKDKYLIGTRMVAASNHVPYNEVFLRVGGVGLLLDGTDDHEAVAPDNDQPPRSLDRGVGLPMALFVRTAKYGHLIAMLRTRARMMHTWPDQPVQRIPLLYITPEQGVQVLTESMQAALWKIAARNLNPFQNSCIAYKTTMEHTEDASFQQKVEELLHLDASIQTILTPQELARIAGGFGATDESVASILQQAMVHDRASGNHKLQDIVNEGLASALRSGDYHTSRQLLILYSLVASLGTPEYDDQQEKTSGRCKKPALPRQEEKRDVLKKSTLGRDAELMKTDLRMIRRASQGRGTLSASIAATPPPPPLDTDRLRSATNSDGLLAVLGAAQILRAMQDGSAKERTQEAVEAVEEWVNYGEQSVAFRISSWYDQRAAQDDLKIATAKNSSFMAFVSNKAVTNRKAFAQQLRDSISMTDFTDIRFLRAIQAMVQRMHSPCLRLELLQYVLGLDNRYSVAHVARSVELAMTCLGISSSSSAVPPSG